MHRPPVGCLAGVLLMTVIPAAFATPLVKRDMYTIAPGATEHQQAILTQAFTDAISLAINALRPPDNINQDQQAFILNKYFPLEDRYIVEAIYDRVIGFNPHSGSSVFSEIVVDAIDSQHRCPPSGSYNFMVAQDKAIAVCPDFWNYIGYFPSRECSDLPQDDITSWRLTFPGASVLNMLLFYVGKEAVQGKSLGTYGVNRNDGPVYSGASAAFFIRGHAPEMAKFSITNYDWYAVELYWTGKCSKSFRYPVNEIENITGECHGKHCTPGPSGN